MYNQVYLYGFDDENKVRIYQYIRKPYISIGNILNVAKVMLDRQPSVCKIIAIDNHFGLRQDYLDTRKKPHFTKDFEFMDMVERSGLIVWQR